MAGKLWSVQVPCDSGWEPTSVLCGADNCGATNSGANNCNAYNCGANNVKDGWSTVALYVDEMNGCPGGVK